MIWDCAPICPCRPENRTHFETRPLRYILYADHISQLMQFHMASSIVRNQGRKSEAPPHRSGAVPGPAWPENREVGGDRDVAGRSDFLSARYAHAVDRQMTGFLHMRMASTMWLKSSM